MTTPDTKATYSGRMIQLSRISARDIDLEDIAHSLSLICRYTGHASSFFSVAEHSVLVSRLVSPELRLPALLHDAHEAYCGDIATPIQHTMPAVARQWLSDLKDSIDFAIAARFRFSATLLKAPEVRAADMQMLATERSVMMPAGTDWKLPVGPHAEMAHQIKFLQPNAARDLFLETFNHAYASFFSKESA